MSRTHWKHTERDAAALFGARRFPANSGYRVDFAGSGFVGQVKNVARLSLAQLEALAVEAADQAHGAVGVLVVKRSAGRGTPTPLLVILTEEAWRALQQQTAPPVRLAG